MKKRSIILLSLFCILSMGILVSLLVFAYETKNAANSPKASIPPALTGLATTSSPASPSINPTDKASVTPTPAASDQKSLVLAFAGDVNFDENNPPARKYDSAGKGIAGILSDDLQKEMKSADIMMLNNEFCYSNRGTKTPEKSYTFRADPGRVDILKNMGVDIVTLANNHALDYGPDALMDTFAALDQAGIKYAGAGANLDRAKAPVYMEAGGRKLAFLAASRVIFAGSWYATDSTPGMVGTYDPALILESIKEARANSDYVVIFLHWGVELKNYPEDYERKLAMQYIDAGADAVIGSHPHVMQGFEYYKGKPIAYSLGNYIFTSRDGKSGFLKLYLDNEGNVKLQLLPAVYSDTYTYLLTDGKAKEDYYDWIRKISYNVLIDKDGFITEKEN